MTTVAQPAEVRPSKLFFILSGEHETLPQAEVTAILESAGIPSSSNEKRYRLLTLEAPTRALALVAERSLMFDCCGTVLGETRTAADQIKRLVRELPIKNFVAGSESFAVRSDRLGGAQKQIRRAELERDVGATISEMIPGISVSLENPDVTFHCTLSEDSFILGISHFTKPSGQVAPRLPRKRPVFHPSTMPPKIARCMVNLARARPNSNFADPFSGVGGITLEAATIGCNVIALDANLRMVRGVRRNLRHFGLEPIGLIKSDARHMPLRSIDAIATDPPYGRGSSTMGVKMAQLIEDFLSGVGDSLTGGSHVCISAPETVNLEDYGRQAGFAIIERHLFRVHRSLTRQILVLRNRRQVG